MQVKSTLCLYAERDLIRIVEYHSKIALGIHEVRDTNDFTRQHFDYLAFLVVTIGMDKLCSAALIYLRLGGWVPSTERAKNGVHWRKFYRNAKESRWGEFGTLQFAGTLETKLFFLCQIPEVQVILQEYPFWKETRNWTTHEAFLAMGYLMDRNPEDIIWSLSLCLPNIVFSPPALANVQDYKAHQEMLTAMGKSVALYLENLPKMEAASQLIFRRLAEADASIDQANWPSQFLPHSEGGIFAGPSVDGLGAMQHFNLNLLGKDYATILDLIDRL